LEREITQFLCQVQTPDARAWLAEVMKSLKPEEISRVVVRLWAIWHARRKALHENQLHSPFPTHRFVKRFNIELETIRPRNKEKQAAGGPAPRWIRPPSGFVKINVDDLQKLMQGFYSCCARDEDGNFLGASALVLEGCTEAKAVEAIACHEGLALAATLVFIPSGWQVTVPMR